MELADLLQECVKLDALDLHLVAAMRPILRVNGQLVPVDGPSLSAADLEGVLAPYLTDHERAQLANGQDIHKSIENGSERFRACIFHDHAGIAAAVRRLQSKVPNLSDLYATAQAERIRSMLSNRRGLILVVGQTGSGKYTSVAAMINDINLTRSDRILTIEDPIEWVFRSKMSLISQREVGRDVESLEQGGLSALKTDCDVVFIGEIRTPEALRVALALAEIGYLVLTTLHASSTSAAVQRLLDSFPDAKESMRAMISRCLVAVVAQKLLPRSDRPGRAAANEVLIANPRVRSMIATGETDFSLVIEAGRSEGMWAMDDSVMDLYQEGTISIETARGELINRDRIDRIASPVTAAVVPQG